MLTSQRQSHGGHVFRSHRPRFAQTEIAAPHCPNPDARRSSVAHSAAKTHERALEPPHIPRNCALWTQNASIGFVGRVPIGMTGSPDCLSNREKKGRTKVFPGILVVPGVGWDEPGCGMGQVK